jgi:hypothetical protein
MKRVPAESSRPKLPVSAIGLGDTLGLADGEEDVLADDDGPGLRWAVGGESPHETARKTHAAIRARCRISNRRQLYRRGAT